MNRFSAQIDLSGPIKACRPTWRPRAAVTLTYVLWQEDEDGSASQFFPERIRSHPSRPGALPTRRFISERGDNCDRRAEMQREG